jgi:hypothetical protein
MNNNYLTEYVKSSINKNGITVKDEKTINYLTEYFENIIFNVVSIASIITYINNCKSINNKSIEIVKKYLDNMCGDASVKKGGSTVLPSEYFGIDSTRYMPTNGIHTDVLQIDFANGLARPQIGGGKTQKKIQPIPANIKHILDYYKLKASKDIIAKLTKLIENYIKCLMQQLKLQNKKISCITIKKIIKSNKLFDIFN